MFSGSNVLLKGLELLQESAGHSRVHTSASSIARLLPELSVHCADGKG